ncbi:AraC family transcriptional regulator [Chryseobacterium arthrosphaerae]|uniref:AraC family transcriptional regulator n=2 Tax=Chryseobacterium arthrosphaerae TaxID=651561 RepID=A0A3S0N609_9FLAO|nr:AraC family transcriptional regulator [Chryseobacterium arthrosphaerae]
MEGEIKKYSFKTALPVEFEIVQLKDLYTKNKKMLTVPHRTSFYHIVWFKSSENIHLIDFEPVETSPDTVLFLSKHKVHSFDERKNLDGLAILFTDDFFCKTEEQTRYLHSTMLFNDLKTIAKISVEDNLTPFTILIELMQKELLQTADTFQPDLLRNLLHNFLLLSDRERSRLGFTEPKKNADLDYVIRFKDILEENYMKRKQVSNFAAEMHITEKRLNRATSRILGKSPKQLIDDRIMLEAKRLLAYTNENVKEISYRLGFEELTNFIKYFKKHDSRTPVEFRESFIAE